MVLASLVLSFHQPCCPAAAAANMTALPPNAIDIEAFWDRLIVITRQALGGTPTLKAGVKVGPCVKLLHLWSIGDIWESYYFLVRLHLWFK